MLARIIYVMEDASSNWNTGILCREGTGFTARLVYVNVTNTLSKAKRSNKYMTKIAIKEDHLLGVRHTLPNVLNKRAICGQSPSRWWVYCITWSHVLVEIKVHVVLKC